ncbi:MAG: DMT family transporter [Anaerolineales bacterium]|nr:DMT family transporter [Anaerolineales bacterium]
MNRSSSPTFLPYVALLSGLALLGMSAILVRLAGAPGTVAAWYRVALAVAVVAPAFGWHIRKHGLPDRRGLVLAALGGLLFAGDLAAWSTGVMISGATNPTLLANTAPLWVGLGALLIFREQLGAGFWAGLALAIAGAALVLGLDAVRSVQLGLGTLLGLLAGVFYGGYFLVTQRGRARLHVLMYFWLSSLVNAVGLLGLNLGLGVPLTGYSTETYLYLGALAIGPQVVGWLAINYAQGHLPASVVSPTLLGQPVVTALLAGPILGERLVPLQIVGGLAVLGGVYWVHRTRLSQKASPQPS